MPNWKITVRYGARHHRYHTLDIDGADVRDALRRLADALEGEVAAEADLVEVRASVDPEARSFLGEDSPFPSGAG
jgi:hypothetical protein